MELYSWYLKITDCLKIPNCKINFFLSHSILKIRYTVSPTFFFRGGELLHSMDEGNLRGVGQAGETDNKRGVFYSSFFQGDNYGRDEASVI